MNPIAENSIIALDKFIQSTRDSGYKSTASAISELVDNAIQACATEINILVQSDECNPQGIRVAIVDNGCGMDQQILTQALRFGGSSRFNDRSGLGRFGMGLPNASLSQAEKVSVYSWQNCKTPICSYLDVGEIASGKLTTVPQPNNMPLPFWIKEFYSASGTAVIWESCDRLDHRRISTIERKLHNALGRIFRYVILDQVTITINGQIVLPLDPLFLDKRSAYSGAKQFDQHWTAEFFANPDNPNSQIGKVQVIFSELPVQIWHSLSNDEKRKIGISNNAGVSIIRGHREVDFGWFFMGSKRRENYDDWWRCEVRFDPILDEAFGITHTKQQIRPKEHLMEALQTYIEPMAKVLNGRARQAYTNVKIGQTTSIAEEIASERDNKLRQLPLQEERTQARQDQEIRQLAERHGAIGQLLETKRSSLSNYHIIEDDLSDSCFFKPLSSCGAIVAVVNPKHQFYKKLYRPIIDSKESGGSNLSNALQLAMLALARAEATFSDPAELDVIERLRREWSQTMDILLNSR